MPDRRRTSVAVLICAFTTRRWALTRRAVESARAQTAEVERVVLCIDNNDELLAMAQAEWAGVDGTPVEVIAKRFVTCGEPD